MQPALSFTFLSFFPIEKKPLLFDNVFIYVVRSILVRENSILFSQGVREKSIILLGKGQGKSGNFFLEKVYEPGLNGPPLPPNGE